MIRKMTTVHVINRHSSSNVRITRIGEKERNEKSPVFDYILSTYWLVAILKSQLFFCVLLKTIWKHTHTHSPERYYKKEQQVDGRKSKARTHRRAKRFQQPPLNDLAYKLQRTAESSSSSQENINLQLDSTLNRFRFPLVLFFSFLFSRFYFF